MLMKTIAALLLVLNIARVASIVNSWLVLREFELGWVLAHDLFHHYLLFHLAFRDRNQLSHIGFPIVHWGYEFIERIDSSRRDRTFHHLDILSF